MRICSPQLGLNPTSVLGGEVFDRETLLGLARKGIKVEIILPKDKRHDKNVKNWQITYLPFAHFPAFLGNFLYLPYLFRIYSKNKFDVLRLHQPQFLALNAILFKIFHPEVKVIATYHQFAETKFGPFSRFVNNFWDYIICDSEKVKQRLIGSYSVNKNKITVVHNGVPAYLKPQKKNQELVKKYDLQNKIVLLFMGFFIKRKNPIFLLKVVKQLVDDKEDVILIYWGSGTQKSEIIKMAKELKIFERVRFIDPLFGPAKNKVHNLADIFVHPALDEGFALAPLESMTCGKTILMNNSHSAAEAVDENGFLCKTNNADDWSKKISYLIHNNKVRVRMGQQSFKKSKEEFSWDKAAEKHLTMLKNLL